MRVYHLFRAWALSPPEPMQAPSMQRKRMWRPGRRHQVCFLLFTIIHTSAYPFIIRIRAIREGSETLKTNQERWRNLSSEGRLWDTQWCREEAKAMRTSGFRSSGFVDILNYIEGVCSPSRCFVRLSAALSVRPNSPCEYDGHSNNFNTVIQRLHATRKALIGSDVHVHNFFRRFIEGRILVAPEQ